MTPSLGVTPDEAQLPEGPPAHRGGHIWAVPVLWAQLSGEQILGLDLPGEWVLGLDLSLGGPCSLPLSSSLIAVNISTKWKRQKKKKKRKKISSLEATRSLWPSQPRLPPEQSAASGPWQPGLLCISVHRQPGGRAARAAFYNPETKKSRSNSETTRLLPGTRSVTSFPAPPAPASVSLPGVCTSLPAPGLGTCLPLSSPLA